MMPIHSSAVTDLLDDGGHSLMRGLAGLTAILLLLALVVPLALECRHWVLHLYIETTTSARHM